eukprot:TRINITY_DN72544_c0_g1_i1.p1 TRINITY_DN72544_c0_g1~~TRINITY_DN72544_c0_g1_i1.p1  ORF type:complete len:645 (+),score=111.99 TRINITY_DN72544_c0_g1_i1:95-2029(+)
MSFALWLVLALSLQPAWAAGKNWYKEEAEHVFVECLTLCALVMCALIFETIFHFLSQPAQHSYHYGMMHNEANIRDSIVPHHSEHKLKHVRLVKELFNRLSGEFMSLGFLAMTIFSANQAGLFDVMANAWPTSCHLPGMSSSRLLASEEVVDPDCFRLPGTATDWLHMVEMVHIKIFLGMMFYFVLIGALVKGSVSRIRSWERLRLRRMAGKAWSPAVSSVTVDEVDVQLAEYKLMRAYFVNKILEWETKRPVLFSQLLDRVQQNEQDTEVDGTLKVKEALEENFAFSAYLSMNVEQAIKESIEVHGYTWVFILCVFAVFALIARTTKYTLENFPPVIIGLAFVLIGVMVWLTKWRKRLIAGSARRLMYMQKHRQSSGASSIRGKSTAQAESSKTCDFGLAPDETTFKSNLYGRGTWSLERMCLRFLQIFLYLISYSFARDVLDWNGWKLYPSWKLATGSAYSCLFLLLMYILPRYVPVFLQLMAIPPFVDHRNMRVLFSLLHVDNTPQKTPMAEKIAVNAKMREKAAARSEDGLRAVAELADLLRTCKSFQDLQEVKDSLDARLSSAGITLPKNAEAQRIGNFDSDAGAAPQKREAIEDAPASDEAWLSFEQPPESSTGHCLQGGQDQMLSVVSSSQGTFHKL